MGRAVHVKVTAVAGTFKDLPFLAPDHIAGKMRAGGRKNGDFFRAADFCPNKAALGKNEPPVFDHEFVGEHLDLTGLETIGRPEIDPFAGTFCEGRSDDVGEERNTGQSRCDSGQDGGFEKRPSAWVYGIAHLGTHFT